MFEPSISFVDIFKLKDFIFSFEENKVEYLHFDVMDGNFVENITFGHFYAKNLEKHTKIKLNCHLMVRNLEKHYEKYFLSNVNSINFHYEALDSNFNKIVKKIKENNIKTGIVINPDTKVEELFRDDIIFQIDYLTIMSVYPGIYGQKFINSSFEKITLANNLKKKYNLNFQITIDGGINCENIKKCQENGANNFAIGGGFVII